MQIESTGGRHEKRILTRLEETDIDLKWTRASAHK